MAFDPQFATFSYPEALSRPAYQREAEHMREDIASAQADVEALERRAVVIRDMLPKLEVELRVCERDIAEKKLDLIKMRNELAAKGGAR